MCVSRRSYLVQNLVLQSRHGRHGFFWGLTSFSNAALFMATVVTQLYLPSGDLLIALENSPFIDSLSWFSYKLLIFHSYVTLWEFNITMENHHL